MAKRRYTTNPLLIRKCSVDGCDRKHAARGLCSRHYDKAKASDSLPPLARLHLTEAFLRAHVAYDGDDCVEWPYHRNKKGYGWANVGGKQNSASRWMCVLAHGDPPFAGAEAAHRCGNRGCVNPNHIRWATPVENMKDQYEHGTRVLGTKLHTAVLSEDQVRAIWRDSRSVSAVAHMHGCAVSTVGAIRAGKTWKHVTQSLGPSAHTSCAKKLTEREVLLIYADTRRQKDIAADFGCSPSLITAIKTGYAWSRVTGHKKAS